MMLALRFTSNYELHPAYLSPPLRLFLLLFAHLMISLVLRHAVHGVAPAIQMLAHANLRPRCRRGPGCTEFDERSRCRTGRTGSGAWWCTHAGGKISMERVALSLLPV